MKNNLMIMVITLSSLSYGTFSKEDITLKLIEGNYNFYKSEGTLKIPFEIKNNTFHSVRLYSNTGNSSNSAYSLELKTTDSIYIISKNVRAYYDRPFIDTVPALSSIRSSIDLIITEKEEEISHYSMFNLMYKGLPKSEVNKGILTLHYKRNIVNSGSVASQYLQKISTRDSLVYTKHIISNSIEIQ